jgi:hypothetical protein
MTQPNFVPIVETDQVRPSYRLRTPHDWRAGRVADLRGPEETRGRELGVPGPDQGYALLLAHTQFEDRLEITSGITAEDALVGCAAVGSRRAALFGRAPVSKDIELGLMLFGFLGPDGCRSGARCSTSPRPSPETRHPEHSSTQAPGI